MYPKTVIKIVDKSKLNPVDIMENTEPPVAFQGASCDKGTEDFLLWQGKDWFTEFGEEQNFRKHGQALKQTAALIQAGAKVYFKRIVAPDAKLANLGIYVSIQKFNEQKKDASGAVLYTSADDGSETTDAMAADGVTANAPIMKNRVNLAYHSIAVDDTDHTIKNNMTKLASAFEALVPASTDGTINLPLFVIAAAGRGVSKLRFRISPDYRYSRQAGYAKYLMEVFEDGVSIDNTMYFSAYPDRIEGNRNISIGMVTNDKSTQIRCYEFEDNMFEFYHTIEQILGLEEDALVNTDFLFGATVRGVAMTDITVDNSDFDLSNVYGNAILNGGNGSFGDRPLESPDYESEMLKVFNGEYSEEIYNLDAVQLDFILDANYPEPVKRAIENFVTFREDAFFMRDMGTEATTIEEFLAEEYLVLHNRYSSSYCNWFKCFDPQTRKHITVTITYLMAPLLVTHFINGRNRPFAGQRYGVYFDYGRQVIKGSVNFLPKETPEINQKQTLDDNGINYCSIYNANRLVVETLYTSQKTNEDGETQLMFSCNVWCIQRVIKALRAQCPLNRGAIITGADNSLEEYQEDLLRHINNFSSDFLTFELEYQNDADYEAQKIYYAVLKVTFKDFVQAEYFRIEALPASYSAA